MRSRRELKLKYAIVNEKLIQVSLQRKYCAQFNRTCTSTLWKLQAIVRLLFKIAKLFDLRHSWRMQSLSLKYVGISLKYMIDNRHRSCVEDSSQGLFLITEGIATLPTLWET